MRILVTSDTHGDLQAWQRLLEHYASGAQFIVHAGDVLYHGPKNPLVAGYAPLQLAEAINACPYPMVMVKGNCDAEVDQQVLEWPLQHPLALLQTPELTLLAAHGDRHSEQDLARLALSYGAGIAVFGHIHQPVLKRVELEDKPGAAVWLLNPGSPSLPKYEEDGRPVASAAVIEGADIRIFGLEDGRTIAQARWR